MPLVGVYQMPFGLRTCLPRGCVPASVGSQAVTTSSLGPLGIERVGDVESEGVVAAPMLADLLAVHPDRRFEVHRAEMQEQPPPAPAPGHLEGAPIPDPLVLADRAA